MPCLINIAKRKEESVLETLSAAIPKIFSALGSFTVDNHIRVSCNAIQFLFDFKSILVMKCFVLEFVESFSSEYRQ